MALPPKAASTTAMITISHNGILVMGPDITRRARTLAIVSPGTVTIHKHSMPLNHGPSTLVFPKSSLAPTRCLQGMFVSCVADVVG
jgi:hypothetical protein